MRILRGFFRGRDHPKNSYDSPSYSYFFGRSNSGKRVNDRTAMQHTVVYACVRVLSEAIAHALTETREFRVEQILPGRTGDALSLCAAMPADILLMEVSRLSAYTLESRLSLIDRLSAKIPGCKFALLCDENSDPELARQVVCARQDRRIDAFLYASVTPAYLVAAMDAL